MKKICILLVFVLAALFSGCKTIYTVDVEAGKYTYTFENVVKYKMTKNFFMLQLADGGYYLFYQPQEVKAMEVEKK